jgi:hypothetical protein
MHARLATRLDVIFSQAVLAEKFRQAIAKPEFFDYIEVGKPMFNI